MEWMILPLRRYAQFSGRSRRKEYWMFTLGMIILFGVLFAGIVAFPSMDDAGARRTAMPVVIVAGLAVLAIFIPSLAVQVRRFHDQDRTGWLVLLGFIPYIGGLIILVFMCIPGTRGPNRYGDDPLGHSPDDLARTFE